MTRGNGRGKKKGRGSSEICNVDTKAVDLFLRFFTPEALDLVIEETNRYASQCRSVNLSAHSRPWRDITREELMAFLACFFIWVLPGYLSWNCIGPPSMS